MIKKLHVQSQSVLQKSKLGKKITGPSLLSCLSHVQDSGKTHTLRTSVVDQWPRFCAPNAEGPGLIPGQGTGPHTPQLEKKKRTEKILSTSTNTLCSQIIKY